jgi:ribosomal-protein-alanine N-acetyltransferase
VTADDHACLHAIVTQPGVRRYMFDDQIVPPERITELIQTSRSLFAKHGFGLWLARRRPSVVGQDLSPGGTHVIGFGAFWFFRDPPELELLYAVADDHIGKGYGREIARAIVRYGFETLQMSSIRASCDAVHADSRRLLEDIGFVFERQAVVGGLDTVFYELRRSVE